MTLPKAGDRPAPARSAGIVAGSFLLGDAAVGAWLWHAFFRFCGKPGPLWPGILGAALAVPILAFALGLHRPRTGARLLLLARAAGLWVLVAALGALTGSLGWLPVSAGEALWLGGAVAALAWLSRALTLGAWAAPPAQPWEMLRWLAVGLAGTLVVLPFYHDGTLGAGDAHWYAIMLSDFLAQVRAGVFPVWVGQGVDAFNGAVSPLRYAPGFQYFGGIVDLLTARSLAPFDVLNASLATLSLLGAYSAYACLRSVARGRPWVACGLAVLWVLGPGVWVPLVAGDQYMSFTAIPFVPVVLYGCWRVWDRDDGWSRFWIASGLAGAWLCHAPVALWMTVVAAAIYLAALLVRRSWAREAVMIPFMGVTFVVLGSVPFISILTLDNRLQFAASAAYAVEVIGSYFPSNFLPINPKSDRLADYQLGYSLLGFLLLSLGLLYRSRPRAAWAFAVASLAIVPFVVPVPWLTRALWMHLPGWFVTIQNVWPMQRLFLVWSSLVAFLAAIMLGRPGAAPSAWRRAALAGAFVGGIAWSGYEAFVFISRITGISASESRMALSPDNLQLTRYAYSSFDYAPAYFSHSYMEPWFENRLLDRHSLDLIVQNADGAAPEAPPGPAPADPSLVQTGLLTATVIAGSSFYQLSPQMTLEPGKRYALRLEFLEPDKPGTLQFMHPSMFREYGMPDSGAGIKRANQQVASLAFGSGPTNSHVIPMAVSGPGPFAISGMFIANEGRRKTYPFARFWLHTYDRKRLPIDVQSWIPYRAKVESPAPAYLETPRMWLAGWRATVNGQPAATLRSPENLVMVPVAAGASSVTLEYHATASLTAAFWLSTAGWLGLCVLGLCQLSLFSAGSPPNLGKARPAKQGRRASRGLWAIPAAGGALLLCAVYALLGRAHAAGPANLAGAGPIRIEFKRPYRQVGLTQPLLSTGHANAGTIVFITFLDSRRVVLGADVWGTLFKSQPLDMDYNQVESLVVSDSALFPLGDPRVKELSQREATQLRGELRLELNGRTVLAVPCNAYGTDPSEILVGESRFGSVSDKKFMGEILKAERLPIPRTQALPAGWTAHVLVQFPAGRTGATEPLLSATAGPDSLLWTVTYLGDHRLRIQCRGANGPEKVAELSYDPAKVHDLRFALRGAGDGRLESASTLEFDGTEALVVDHAFPGLPPVLVCGVAADAPGMQVRFTGPRMDFAIVPQPPRPPRAPRFPGAEHMIVRLPTRKAGRSEPLLVTGRPGKGDFVYVTYLDEGHIRISYDHWGYGGSRSDPIAVDYGVPHEIWIGLGSLYPAQGDDAGWRGVAPAERRHLSAALSVVLDGASVLSSAAEPYPAGPGEVAAAANRIGGSTCDAEFSGILEFSERVGAPPTTQGR